MGTEQITSAKTVRGKKYDLYTTYPTREQALKAAKILRSYGEKAFVVRGYTGDHAVYHRDEYSDVR